MLEHTILTRSLSLPDVQFLANCAPDFFRYKRKRPPPRAPLDGGIFIIFIWWRVDVDSLVLLMERLCTINDDDEDDGRPRTTVGIVLLNVEET